MASLLLSADLVLIAANLTRILGPLTGTVSIIQVRVDGRWRSPRSPIAFPSVAALATAIDDGATVFGYTDWSLAGGEWQAADVTIAELTRPLPSATMRQQP
jgi:hypothetical protein